MPTIKQVWLSNCEEIPTVSVEQTEEWLRFAAKLASVSTDSAPSIITDTDEEVPLYDFDGAIAKPAAVAVVNSMSAEMRKAIPFLAEAISVANTPDPVKIRIGTTRFGRSALDDGTTVKSIVSVPVLQQCGVWALHFAICTMSGKTSYMTPRLYRVTHIPTGMYVGQSKFARSATGYVKELGESFGDFCSGIKWKMRAQVRDNPDFSKVLELGVKHGCRNSSK